MDITTGSVVVTGAASGLGAATARKFAEVGAEVIGIDLPESIDRAEAVNGVHLVGADVASEAEVTAALDVASMPIRVAVNCAGVGWVGRILGKDGPHDLQLYRRILDINLVGTFNVMRLAAHQMRQADPVDNDGQRGVIINTASGAAFEGQVGQVAYAASKGGVHAMTISAARDLASSGIRVVTIAPGTIETPMFAGVSDDFIATLTAGIPFPQRLGKPEEFASLAAHIVEHDYLNGETIRMDAALRMAPR